MRVRRLVFVLSTLALAVSCGKDAAAPTAPSVTLAAPAVVSPADNAQITSLRPTLVVKNATAGTTASLYEFQVSDKSDFSTTGSSGQFSVLAHRTGITEGTGGNTSYTPDFDMQPATHLFWRARYVQGTTVSDWSATRSVNTAIAGFSIPGALYDPLVNSATVGVPAGSTAFVDGQGIRINDTNSYVRYQLMQTIPAGEFSMDVVGLRPEGPGAKLKVFSMMDGTGDLFTSPWLFDAQYRGANGNPDDAISFKMLIGDPAYKLEPDGGQRSDNVFSLDPGQDYFWKGTWGDGFHLTVQQGMNGPTIYDLELKSSDILGMVVPYAPSPHFAYLGANNGPFGEEDGSWPGVTYRNVWIGNRPRPASLGTALQR